MPTIQILLATAGGGGGIEPGQQEYTTPGTYTWVAPATVTAVSAVAVGGGGGGKTLSLIHISEPTRPY